MADQTINLPNNESLVRRALNNARSRDPGQCLRWVAVMDTFALGSTYSMHLCRKFDLDPHEMVGIAIDDDCDHDEHGSDG